MVSKRQVLQVFGCEEGFDLLKTQPSNCRFFELFGARQVAEVLGAIDHFGRGHYPEMGDALEVATETVPIAFWVRH